MRKMSQEKSPKWQDHLLEIWVSYIYRILSQWAVQKYACLFAVLLFVSSCLDYGDNTCEWWWDWTWTLKWRTTQGKSHTKFQCMMSTGNLHGSVCEWEHGWWAYSVLSYRRHLSVIKRQLFTSLSEMCGSIDSNVLYCNSIGDQMEEQRM